MQKSKVKVGQRWLSHNGWSRNTVITSITSDIVDTIDESTGYKNSYFIHHLLDDFTLDSCHLAIKQFNEDLKELLK